MTIIEIEKPDMSFTQDPEWLERREALWEHYCDFQYDELRKEKLRVQKKYFFAGDFDNPRENGRGSSTLIRGKIDTFPLRTPEGWDYVIYMFGGFDRSKTELTDLLVYQVMASLTYRGWSLEEELVLWDYFLPETYQPVVQTPGPTKRQKGPIEGELPVVKVVNQFCGRIGGVFSGINDSPKYLFRSKFILSALQSIKSEDFLVTTKLGQNVPRLMALCYRDQHEVELGNRECLAKYIKEFKHGMETLEFDPAVKALWEDVKREHG